MYELEASHTRFPVFSYPMELDALKNVKTILNTNIYSSLETSGAQSSNLYRNVVQFFNTSIN
jgi:hypothetical protein